MAGSAHMAPLPKVPRFGTLIACAVMVVLLALLGRAFAAWTFHAYSINMASRDAGHIATILAHRTAQSIQAIDEALAALQREWIEHDTPFDGLQAGAGGPRSS